MSQPTAPAPGRRLLELFVLSGLALGQPLLDVFGRSGETFVYRQVGLSGILVFTVLVIAAPPVLLWLPTLLCRRWPLVVKVAHDAAMGALWIVLAIQLVKRLPDDIPVFVELALTLILVGFAVTLQAAGRLRLWFTYLSPAPLVFAAVFLLATPVSTTILASAKVPAKQVAVSRPSPVVMVVFDEFPLTSIVGPDGHVDEDLFPGFANLEREATFFGNTVASAQATVTAVPSLLSGKAATSTALPMASAHPDTLFTLLGGSHEMRVHELLSLCPDTICDRAGRRPFLSTGLPALATDVNETLLALLDPRQDAGRSEGAIFGEAITEMMTLSAEDSRQDVSGFRVAGRFSAFLDDIVRPWTGKPTLSFLHILLPHAPWTLLPDGRQYAEPGSLTGLRSNDVWSDDRTATDLARQRHLLQVQHVDRLVTELTGRMRDAGLWEEATVVITGDHGVSTRAGEPRRVASSGNLHELAWVPLFIKTPHQRSGGLDTRPAQSTDILPTIADALDVAVPWTMDGTSLLQPASPSEPRRFLASDDRSLLVDHSSRGMALAGSAGAVAPGKGDPYRLFRLPRTRSSLVGERLGDLEVLPATAGRVRSAATPQAVLDPDSGWSPALISGSIIDARVSEVVVTVNGVVAAVTTPFKGEGRDGRFAAMTPPHLYRTGVNDVRVFSLVQRGGRYVLRPLPPA